MSNLENNNEIMKRFGEKLRTLREREGLSLRQLGEKLDVSKNYIWTMEMGHKTPNIAMLIKIARLFNVTADQLIMDDQDLD